MTDSDLRNRPLPLTNAQVKDLAAGKNPTFGQPMRPRVLSAAQVETLKKGEKLDFEKLPMVPPISQLPKAHVASPITLTEKEMESLRRGIDIGKFRN
jgi:hypothetical protein